jgi:hypothetical protein
VRTNPNPVIETWTEDQCRARLLAIWAQCGRDQYHARDEVRRLRDRLATVREERQYQTYQRATAPIDPRD